MDALTKKQKEIEQKLAEEREKMEKEIRRCVSREMVDMLKKHFRVNEPVFHFKDAVGRDTTLDAQTISLRASFMDGRSDVIHFLEKIITQ